MSTLFADLRYVARTLRARPFFTAVAVLSLALGIGANTAIFSIVESTLLRPLPFRDSGQLVFLNDQQPAFADASLSPGEFLNYQRYTRTLIGVAALSWQNLTITGIATPQNVRGRSVTPNFFDILGARAERGRLLSAAIDRPDAESRTAVISDGLWRSTFGSDPGIVGRNITLNAKPFKIVGVLAPQQEYPANVQIWVTPRTIVPEFLETGPPSEKLAQIYGNHWMLAIGRLRPGTTLEQAQAELHTIADRIHRDQHTGELHWAKATPLQGALVERVRPAILVLSVAVFALLLIGCANLAGLLLARTTGRTRELSIRLALGAARSRIVSLLLLESACVTGLGAILAVLLAKGALTLLEHFAPYDLPPALAPQLNTPVLLFCLGISAFAALLTGIVPGLQASRVNVQDGLKESSKGSASGGTLSIRRFLVTGEIALSVVLLVGALLLVRSFTHILAVDPGFAAARLTTAQIALPAKRYPDDARAVHFWDHLQRAAATLSGVESASLSMFVPVAGVGMGGDFDVPGHATGKGAEAPYADFPVIGPGLLHTLRTPLLAGREFNELDGESSPRVVLINKYLADRYFPGENPVGKQLRRGTGADDPMLTIVGVVANVKWNGLDEKKHSLDIYLPYSQAGSVMNSALVLRTQPGANVTASELQRLVQSLDTEIPISEFQSLEIAVDKSLGQRRFLLGLLASFTALAILLAAIGLYAILSFTVGQRRREIGIRVAIGASRGRVLWLVLRDSLLMAAAGLAIGIGGAYWSTSLLQSLLFGVTSNDALAYAGAVVLIALTTLAASSIPALRAARTDPAIALRYE